VHAALVASGAFDELGLGLACVFLGFLAQESLNEMHVGPKPVLEGHPTHHVKAFLTQERVGRNGQHKRTPSGRFFEVVFVAHLKRELKRALHLEDDAAEEADHAFLASTVARHPRVDADHDQ